MKTNPAHEPRTWLIFLGVSVAVYLLVGVIVGWLIGLVLGCVGMLGALLALVLTTSGIRRIVAGVALFAILAGMVTTYRHQMEFRETQPTWVK